MPTFEVIKYESLASAVGAANAAADLAETEAAAATAATTAATTATGLANTATSNANAATAAADAATDAADAATAAADAATAAADTATGLANTATSQANTARDAANDAAAAANAAAAAASVVSYDVPITIQGRPAASEVLFYMPVVRAFSLPASLAGSRARSVTSATGSSVFSIEKAEDATPTTWVQIGTLTFGVAASEATAAGAGASFAEDDLLRVVAPASQDATLADLGLTLKGSAPV